MLSSQRMHSNKALYLTTSRTGIYAFRWNIRRNGIHHQPTLSLKTRDILEATKLSLELVKRIRELIKPTVEDIKAIYSDFINTNEKNTKLLKDIDIREYLSDLTLHTVDTYARVWGKFMDTLSDDIAIEDIREIHIKNWKNKLKGSYTTIKKNIGIISSCLIKLDAKTDPKWFTIKKKPNDTKKRRAVTKDELNKLLQATVSYKDSEHPWRYYIPRIAALTGCRINEIAQLKVNDIYLTDKPYISINDNTEDKSVKNNTSRREIPMTHELVALLSEVIKGKQENENVFKLKHNKHSGYGRNPVIFFSAFFKELGLNEVTFHSIRHYVITELFNADIKEELISSIVGHSIGKSTSGKVYMSGFKYEKKLEALRNLSLK